MVNCPACGSELTRHRNATGIYYACGQCGGRMVSIAQLRRQHTARQVLIDIWQEALADGKHQGRNCPHCGRRMALIELPLTLNGVKLDVCTLCAQIWFDPHEYEYVPHSAAERQPETLHPEVRKAVALAEVQRIREEADDSGAVFEVGLPDSGMHYLMALFGLPVETNSPALKHTPYVTRILAGICILAFALSAMNLGQVVNLLGFIPERWFRLGGLTMVTAFFLHGGVWHLLGNMYFLTVFGDNVEDELGSLRFALLLVAAHLAGMLVHGLFDPNRAIPCVGASAGISGLMAYYAVAFRRIKLGIVIFFQWIRIPAYIFFAFWIMMQLFTAVSQISGFSSVSALAHLGGVAAGLVAVALVRWAKLGDMRRARG